MRIGRIGSEPSTLQPEPPRVDGPKAVISSSCGKFRHISGKVFCDDRWMLFLVLFFGVATQSFSLVGGGIATYAPYLSIISSPLYLVHALRESQQQTKLIGTGVKAHNVALTVFFLVGALSSIGTALGDVTKPFAGGIALAGLSAHGTLAFIAHHVLPLLMIVTGGIGGLASILTFWRMHVENEKFREKPMDDFQRMAEILRPIEATDPKSLLLEEKRQSCFFSNAEMRQVLETKFKERESQTRVQIQKILTKMQAHVENLQQEADLVKQLNSLEALCDDVEELSGQKAEIVALKNEIRSDCQRFCKGIEQEIQQRVIQHSIALFMAVLTIVGGFLTVSKVPYERIIGSALIITGSLAGMGGVLFEKLEPPFFPYGPDA